MQCHCCATAKSLLVGWNFKFMKAAILIFLIVYLPVQIRTAINISRAIKQKQLTYAKFLVSVTENYTGNFNINNSLMSSMAATQATAITNSKSKSGERDYQPKSINTMKEDSTSSCKVAVKLLRGRPRSIKGFLTIGVSTVPRSRESYLFNTIRSLVDNLKTEDRTRTVIVIYIGSDNALFVDETTAMVDKHFAKEVNSSLVQVIQPFPSIYPNLSEINIRTFDDSVERMQWRRKQNIDYAQLFAYSIDISKYYIHVEDDVVTIYNYISTIEQFITSVEAKGQLWITLEFSSLGFIGKLFKSTDLCKISKFLILFQEEKPCDLLIDDLRAISTQGKSLKSQLSIFQHKGVHSSLLGKIQKLVDSKYKTNDLDVQFRNSTIVNPPADISTSFKPYSGYNAERAYFSFETGFFWVTSVNEGDFYLIEFESMVNITNVLIHTGHPISGIDRLENAKVKIATGNNTNDDKCGEFKDIGIFENGVFRKNFITSIYIKCMRINVYKKQTNWAIISNIELT